MKCALARKVGRPLLASVGAAAFAALAATSASAEESPYCEKVRARADSDAALLYGPKLRAEALKLPSAIQPNGRVDPVGAGTTYQFRAGLSVSAIDVYKAARLADVADADCAHHAAATAAQEILAFGVEVGRLPALRSEVAYLDAHRPEWEKIAAKTDELLEAKTLTLLNVTDIRARTLGLVRRRAQVAGELGRFEALGVDRVEPALTRLMNDVDASAMRYEREGSRVRKLDAWDLTLTGGYVPPILDAPKSDFFGLVQVSYNLGGPWQSAAERRYLAAREEELRRAKHELRHQLTVLREQVARTKEQAHAELDALEPAIDRLRSDRASVVSSGAAAAFYATAMIDLELINAEAERQYLMVLMRELSRHLEA